MTSRISLAQTVAAYARSSLQRRDIGLENDPFPATPASLIRRDTLKLHPDDEAVCDDPKVLFGRRWLVIGSALRLPRRVEPIRVELNALESAEDRCRVSFVIENKAPRPRSTACGSSSRSSTATGSCSGAWPPTWVPLRGAKTDRQDLHDRRRLRRDRHRSWSTRSRLRARRRQRLPRPARAVVARSRTCGSTNSARAHSACERPVHPVARHAFIDSKNSPLLLVLRSLSSRKSIASIVPIGLRMRRRMYIFLS